MRDLINRYRFFRPGNSALRALQLARAEQRALANDLTVVWEDEHEAWDGEGPAPNYLQYAYVPDPDGSGCPLASLGMIGFDSIHDPYLRVEEAYLLEEALSHIDASNDRASTAAAEELQGRATYALTVPE